MTTTKSLVVAVTALAISFGAVLAPASAKPMMSHKHMMMHHKKKMMMMHHKMMHHKMMHHKMMHKM